MTFGDHLWLARRYDVPPVRIDANAQDAGVVGTQLVRVMQTQAGAVADERVHLRVHVVRFQHVVAWPRVRIERVAGLRRIIETLREKPWRTFDYTRSARNVADVIRESEASGPRGRPVEGLARPLSASDKRYVSCCFCSP